MEAENSLLGDYAEDFMVASNLEANDKNWASDDADWVGKASMAERHRFLILRSLDWQNFNVLAFGRNGDNADNLT